MLSTSWRDSAVRAAVWVRFSHFDPCCFCACRSNAWLVLLAALQPTFLAAAASSSSALVLRRFLPAIVDVVQKLAAVCSEPLKPNFKLSFSATEHHILGPVAYSSAHAWEYGDVVGQAAPLLHTSATKTGNLVCV